MAATELRAELGHSSCDKDADSDVIKHEVSVMSSGVTPVCRLLKAAGDGGCWVEEAPSRAQKQEGKGLHPSHLAVEYL